MTETEFLATFDRARRLLGHFAKKLARRPVFGQQDLMQEAILALWRSRAKMAGVANPIGWMVHAGRWAMMNRISTHDRRHRLHSQIDIDDERCDPPTVLPPVPDEFETLIGLLATPDAELLRRRFGRGDHLARIGADAGASSQSAVRRINAAVNRLRDRLACGDAVIG